MVLFSGPDRDDLLDVSCQIEFLPGFPPADLIKSAGGTICNRPTIPFNSSFPII